MSETAFKIPERFLEPEPEPQIEGIQENGTAGGHSSYLDELVEFGKFICESGDEFAKERDYPGIRHVPPEQLGELLGRIADKRLPEWLKSKTQDATGVGLLLTIATDNYLHWRKQQLENPNQKEDQTPENEK